MPKETVLERRARKSRVEKAAQKSRSSPPPVAADEGKGAPPPDEPVQLPEVLDLRGRHPARRALLERRGNPTVVDALRDQSGRARSASRFSCPRSSTWEDDGVPLTFVNCGPLLIEHLRFLGHRARRHSSAEPKS